MGCETSWCTTFGADEDAVTEGQDDINPVTEGERKVCGRTSTADESVIDP
jgi:hypothetical protein